MENEFDRALLFVFPALMWLPWIHPKLPMQRVSVENYLKLNFQTAFPLPTPALPSDCLKDVAFPVAGTQF